MTSPSTFAHVPIVLNGGQNGFRDAIASAIGWWADAGLDTFVDETPRDWLAPPPKPEPRPAPGAAPAAAVAKAPTPAPDTLADLHALLATGAYAPQAAPVRSRVAPSGDPASGLMIITDMPEPADADAGRLFAGETDALFDAMLAAMGRDRASIYLAPLSPARLAGGRIDRELCETLAALMRRHIRLAAPRALLLFGDETGRALFGEDGATRRRGLRAVNHDGGMVPAIAVTHPRLLRQYPAMKAGAWADMRLLLGELAR